MEKPKNVVTVVLAAALAIAGPVFRGWRAYERMHAKETAAEARAAGERAAADRERADEIRVESEFDRTRADDERRRRDDASLAMAMRQLESDSPMTQCSAALALGRFGSAEPVVALRRMLASSTHGSVRNCAASALVRLGDKDTPWAAYREWATGGDPELQRAAVMGLGDIGPEAANDALPYLHAWADSPNMDQRYLAVETLAKLGPAGMPLLEQLAGDTDKNVRDHALSILRATPVTQ
jgi:HEAT repeat protein